MTQLSEVEQLKKLAIKRRLLIDGARAGNIIEFTKYTFPKYQISWHHELTSHYINQFIQKKIRRLMIFEPPRHGKSELTSRRLPALIHGLFPNDEIMAASYNSDLASDMTVDTQRIIDSDRYRDIFPTVQITKEASKSQYARSRNEHEIVPWQDPEDRLWHYYRGSYRSAGVGGSFTGRGADWLILDDLIKNREDADSENYREALYKWYQSSMRTRLEGIGSIIFTITRWHEDDLAGRLLEAARKDPKADQWVVLNLPAVKEVDGHPDDPREAGEPLWPQKFNKDVLETIRATVGEREWSALYQQEPTPASGALFNRDMFEFADMPNQFDYTFAISDTAYKDKQENDFTVVTVFGVANAGNPELFIIDVYRKQIKAALVEEPIAAFLIPYQDYGFRGVYIEPKGHGIYLNQKLPSLGVMVPSEDLLDKFFSDRRMDKVQRANNAIPRLTNRKVYINKNIHTKDELLREVLTFPRAKHDDFVDTLIDGIKFVFDKQHGILDLF